MSRSNDDLPQGFELFDVCGDNEKYGGRYIQRLALPSSAQGSVEQYNATIDSRVEARRAAVIASTAPVKKEEDDGWGRSVQNRQQKEAENELKSATDKLRNMAEFPPDGSIPVYAWDEPLKLISRKSTDRDYTARYKHVFEQLSKHCHHRLIARLKPAQLELAYERLVKEHPGFGEVLKFVFWHLRLSTKQKPKRISPILLIGPPGTGKTHFSQSLAEALGAPVHKIAFDAAHNSSTLLGSDKTWGNTSSGLVFDAICLGTHANPVVVLDELDKARINGGYQDPRSSLHSLLEPVSASKVKDISLDFEFSAAHITWIATANDPTRIPESLRSRFKEFRIEQPSGAAALQMAEVMVKATHQSLSIKGFRAPSRDVSRLIAHLTPREQRQALEQAYANAVANGRLELLKTDFPADVLWEEERAGQQSKWLH